MGGMRSPSPQLVLRSSWSMASLVRFFGVLEREDAVGFG